MSSLLLSGIRQTVEPNIFDVRADFALEISARTELEQELESQSKSVQASHRWVEPSAWDPKQAYNVLQDLIYLHKDSGFTPARIAKARLVRQLLGGDNESYEVLRERIISAIQSLRDPQPEILLDVFGLAPETEGVMYLKDRRRHYGNKHGIKVEAVADREETAMDNLRKQLVTGWYPKSPTGFSVPQSHNGFVQQSARILTVVRNRAWQENRQWHRLIAAFDEADYISISSSYPGRPIPEGDFTVKTERIKESYTHRFFYKEPMRRGETYDLKFRLVADEDLGTPGALTEQSQAFHEPTRFASFGAMFIGERPNTIWSFRGLSYFERPGTPQIGHPLEFGDERGVREEFHDLYGGLYSGIAWEW